MRVLITGANGFIGTNLVKYLQEAGWSLRILVRSESRIRHVPSRRMDIVTVDYSDYTTLIKPLKGVDMIFHLAGITKGTGEADFHRGNVMPLENLCRAIIESKAKLRHLVFTSSQAAGGPAINCELPSTETNYRGPIELYGESKLAAEGILKKHGRLIPYTILRLAAVYGPWDADFLMLFKQLHSGLNMYYGDKYKYVNMIHVTDALSAITRSALNDRTRYQLYYIGDKYSFSWQMIHNSILRAAGREGFEISLPFFCAQAVCMLGSLWMKTTGKPVLLNSEKLKLGRPKYWACSSDKAKEEFGFSPGIPIEEGILQTMHWYLENGWLKPRR